jgi:hypothetical protein
MSDQPVLLPESFPPLKGEAGKLARELYDVIPPTGGNDRMPWEQLWSSEKTHFIEGVARLLRDLSRPATRDHWVRWLEADNDWVLAQNEAYPGNYADVLEGIRDEPQALLEVLLKSLK